MRELGYVLSVVGLIITAVGLLMTDTGQTPNEKSTMFDDWSRQGEMIVFQRKEESINDAIRRLRCEKGIVVRYKETEEPRTILLAGCKTDPKDDEKPK